MKELREWHMKHLLQQGLLYQLRPISSIFPLLWPRRIKPKHKMNAILSSAAAVACLSPPPFPLLAKGRQHKSRLQFLCVVHVTGVCSVTRLLFPVILLKCPSFDCLFIFWCSGTRINSTEVYSISPV